MVLLLLLLYFQFLEFEKSLDTACPSEADGIGLLKSILTTVKSGTNLPTYTSFEAFNVDVDWILDQYKEIFDGLFHFFPFSL